MKKIENKQFTEGDNSVTYKDLIMTCLKQPVQGGFSYDDIKARIRIEEALESANGTIELEDSDAENMKLIVSTSKWGMVDKRIIEFCDTIKEL